MHYSRRCLDANQLRRFTQTRRALLFRPCNSSARYLGEETKSTLRVMPLHTQKTSTTTNLPQLSLWQTVDEHSKHQAHARAPAHARPAIQFDPISPVHTFIGQSTSNATSHQLPSCSLVTLTTQGNVIPPADELPFPIPLYSSLTVV